MFEYSRAKKHVRQHHPTCGQTWMDTLLQRFEAMMPCQLLSYTTLSWMVRKSESSWGSNPYLYDTHIHAHEWTGVSITTAEQHVLRGPVTQSSCVCFFFYLHVDPVQLQISKFPTIDQQ